MVQLHKKYQLRYFTLKSEKIAKVLIIEKKFTLYKILCK